MGNMRLWGSATCVAVALAFGGAQLGAQAKPANATGKIGPDLDNLKASAAKANRGPLDKFIEESIVDPSAYVAPGFSDGVMPHIYKQQIPPDQLQQLVQYLGQGAK